MRLSVEIAKSRSAGSTVWPVELILRGHPFRWQGHTTPPGGAREDNLRLEVNIISVLA